MRNQDVLKHWLNWYMKPMILPWDYFPDYAPNLATQIKLKMVKPQAEKFYQTFADAMVSSIGHAVQFDLVLKNLKTNPNTMNADEFFTYIWRWLREMLLQSNQALEKLEQMQRKSELVALGGMIALLENRVIRQEVNKLDAFESKLHEIWLYDYQTWLKQVSLDGA